MSLLVNSPPGDVGGGSGTKESQGTSHEHIKLEEDLKTEDWPRFSGCIFDYARFRMTLNSFPPLKNQRVKGSRARLIAKFCLPWDREDLLGWEGDEDAFWVEVKNGLPRRGQRSHRIEEADSGVGTGLGRRP